MANLSKIALLLVLSFGFLQAETVVGKVYGKKTWIVYIGSSNGLYLKKGSTDFASVCDTGFINKGSYVLAPDGSSYKSKNSVLTAIQRRLLQGKYKSHGCQ